MKNKAKTHVIEVRVTFDKSCTPAMARKLFNDSFRGYEQYPDIGIWKDGMPQHIKIRGAVKPERNPNAPYKSEEPPL